jgi:hypothetical protein
MSADRLQRKIVTATLFQLGADAQLSPPREKEWLSLFLLAASGKRVAVTIFGEAG